MFCFSNKTNPVCFWGICFSNKASLEEIIESQETVDKLVLKNSDDIILIKKQKEENGALIKSLDEKI